MKNFILVVLTTLVLGILCFVFVSRDTEGPEIIFPSEGITYQEGQSEDQLLNGVKAVDEKDGDVSDSLRIEKIENVENEAKIIVSYVAKDSNNNITKVKKVIDNATTAATPQEELSNEQKSENEIASLPSESPRIYLTEYEVTLPLGSEFYPLNYVRDIVDDVDSRELLFTRIELEGEVNTAVAGTYQLTFYAIDSNQNTSNHAVMTVVVG
ncbi:immunoglobulin-like domain-containing protein [Floccifex sp.]|uniref:immunoglobulin-like domain-containing protein n=1 Tax=Floccifex sp. TaxID=2815810 RepID=UPI003F0B69CA